MVAASLVDSLAASWVGSRVVVVKLVNRRIEIHRMLVLVKPVARQIEQLHRMVSVVNSSGGRRVDQLKQRPSGGDDDGRTNGVS